jgi:hypothetical protein
VYDRATRHFNATVLSSSSPRLLLIRDFLSPAEVEHLVRQARGERCRAAGGGGGQECGGQGTHRDRGRFLSGSQHEDARHVLTTQPAHRMAQAASSDRRWWQTKSACTTRAPAMDHGSMGRSGMTWCARHSSRPQAAFCMCIQRLKTDAGRRLHALPRFASHAMCKASQLHPQLPTCSCTGARRAAPHPPAGGHP